VVDVEDGEILCDRLRRLRKARVLTVRELSEESGVHYVTISRAENNPDYIPRPGTLRKLARALGVSVEYLATGHSA
jgi:transcriptional regulator with XRE-family HTH domain